MMENKNPFNNLYLAESIPAKKFIKIFSPALLKESETHQLFQPGSVILRGTQGTGKSALLNLLKPDILFAYMNSEEKWPLPKHCSKFISANIVLRSSGALDFGQREISSTDNEAVVGLYFADFLNYWIVDDLLRNLKLYQSDDGARLSNFLGLNITDKNLDNFAKILAKNRCWFDALAGITEFSSLTETVERRISLYEGFLNYNSDLPIEISNTKTKPGDPIGAAYDALRECGILPDEVPLFVTIDQFEDLMDLEKDEHGSCSTIFRSVVMRMLGNRDSRVSYRVGARPYSLTAGVQGFGNNAFTEEMREFRIVDIGELLQTRESKKSLFPAFCDDVLFRRLKEVGMNVEKRQPSYTKYIFGSRVSPEEKVERFIQSTRSKIISLGNEWPADIRDVLARMALEKPISAKLGEAWLLQNADRMNVSADLLASEPWQDRPWWKKERKQLALLQIFSASNQRLVWYGSNDIISLCNKSIFTFLSICQFIWAEYLRSSENIGNDVPQNIDAAIQAMGIMSASEYWVRKVKAEPKGGDDRHKFINVVGSFFRDKMKSDKRMSYPGANGFSLSLSDVEENAYIDTFLDNCVAFGVLEKARHVPKSKSRGQSMKWYVSSILTPYFQIPTAHTKEPFYASIGDITDWLDDAKVTPITQLNSSKSRPQKVKGTDIPQFGFDFSRLK
jgi:hypothetical protein